MVMKQLKSLDSDFDISGIKLSILGSLNNITVIQSFLESKQNLPIVYDPVIEASSKDTLTKPEEIETIKKKLLPLVTHITPNIPEAAKLLSIDETQIQMNAAEVARNLKLICANDCAVIIKGGHSATTSSDDTIFIDKKVEIQKSAKIFGKSVRGTGCAYASALVCNLVLGHNTVEAAQRSKNFVRSQIKKSLPLGTDRHYMVY